MVAVAQIYRAVAERKLDAQAGRRRLSEVYPAAAFSNGFLHGRPGHELIERTADAR
jgi:hypothetical protein